MCLGIPMRLVERRGIKGIAESGGVRREVSLLLVPEAKEGDYVVVHAGFAISVIDEEEARRTLDILRQLSLGEGADTEVS